VLERGAHTTADYEIRVAEDQLTATVRLEAGGQINTAHLIEQLTRAGIKSIDHAAINAAAEAMQKRAADAAANPTAAVAPIVSDELTLVVARGQAAVEDVPESLTRIDPAPPAEPPANHYERVRLITVEPNDAIATIKPAILGHDGVDVFGKPIHRKRHALPIAPGDGATRNGEIMLANRAGRVRIDGSSIRVEPRLDIAGDVSFATGNVRFDGDVNIRGSVLDVFVVESTADIHVGAAIEAAQVRAGHELTVAGGIAGKDKGVCTAGGNVSCRYISNAEVHAGNCITVHGEIANSRIVSGGALLVESGSIRASHVSANGGVVCKSIGNPAFVKTIVEAGTDLKLKKLAADLLPKLNRCISEAQHIKQFAHALMRDPKRLTEQQKEEATNLLLQVRQTDAELAAKLDEFREACRISQERCKPEITVQEQLYPGVMIRLPGLTATVRDLFSGPLKISVVSSGKRPTIAITNTESGSVIALPTYKTERDDIHDVRAILQIAA